MEAGSDIAANSCSLQLILLPTGHFAALRQLIFGIAIISRKGVRTRILGSPNVNAPIFGTVVICRKSVQSSANVNASHIVATVVSRKRLVGIT